MATCNNEIFANVMSTCENKISSGIEQTVYLFNRKDLAPTYKADKPNVVTSLGIASGVKPAFVAKGLKKNLTSGFERVISDTAPDSWTNSLNLIGYEFSADKSRNMDEMGDLVAIIKRKGKDSVDGSFLALGLENGLFTNSDSWDANDNGGARMITMQSLDDAGESYSAYVVTLEDVEITDGEGETKTIETVKEIEDYLESLIKIVE